MLVEADRPIDRHGAGILLFIVGMALFTLNDAMGKWLVGHYSVGQLVLLRSLAAFLVLLPWIWHARRAIFRPRRFRLHLVRVVMMSVEVAAFYWAVRYLPLADVMTFYQASPLFVAVLAAPLLGERDGLRHLGAVAVGFLGVLVVLDPSAASFGLPALAALFGTLLFSLILIATRKLRCANGTALITYQMVSGIAAGGGAAPFYWVQPTPVDLAMLFALGVVAMGAHLLVNRALSLAPAGVVAPYQYSSILWAVILGYVIFDDPLTWRMAIGNLIIIASGLYIFQRERRYGPG
jgi:drug/metabolite transporter (DMT)-like permease